MKDIICFSVFALVLAGCCGCFDRKTEVVVVEKPVPVQVRPVTYSEVIETEETVTTRPCCHTLVGDTLKATVLILTDVVGLVIPIDDGRKTTLRRRTFEGW